MRVQDVYGKGGPMKSTYTKLVTYEQNPECYRDFWAEACKKEHKEAWEAHWKTSPTGKRWNELLHKGLSPCINDRPSLQDHLEALQKLG